MHSEWHAVCVSAVQALQLISMTFTQKSLEIGLTWKPTRNIMPLYIVGNNIHFWQLRWNEYQWRKQKNESLTNLIVNPFFTKYAGVVHKIQTSFLIFNLLLMWLKSHCGLCNWSLFHEMQFQSDDAGHYNVLIIFNKQTNKRKKPHANGLKLRASHLMFFLIEKDLNWYSLFSMVFSECYRHFVESIIDGKWITSTIKIH